MMVLLTNDDGFLSFGIRHLKERLEKAGLEAWICAPACQRSAFSHALSFHEKVYLRKEGERVFSCSGTPVDCMVYGINSGLFPRPDLVISGINHGYNRSTDLLYSGTAGAAREAAMMGFKAIAISAEKGRPDSDPPVRQAADFLAAHLEDFLGLDYSCSFLNINVPENTDGRTWLPADTSCLRFYERTVIPERTEDPDRYCCRIADADIVNNYLNGDSDVEVTDRGVISVSSIRFEPAADLEVTSKLKVILDKEIK